MKLSQWHNGSVKPVHIGVYQKVTVDDPTIWYSYWDGKCFSGGSHTKDAFYKKFIDIGIYPVQKWRGIVKDEK